MLRGRLTTLGAAIDPWWARDDTLSEPDLGDFVSKGLVGECIAEKEAAVQLWQRIDDLVRAIHFPDAATGRFARVSARYGVCKYSAIAAGWTVILLLRSGLGRLASAGGRGAAVPQPARAESAWRRPGAAGGHRALPRLAGIARLDGLRPLGLALALVVSHSQRWRCRHCRDCRLYWSVQFPGGL